MIGRRSFITGLIALVAAPAIVRAGSLMPVKQMIDVAPEISISGLRGTSLSAGDTITFESFSKVRQFLITNVGTNNFWVDDGNKTFQLFI